MFPGKPVGETILYFGCRRKAEDFLYQEELEGYMKTGLLTVSIDKYKDHSHSICVTCSVY